MDGYLLIRQRDERSGTETIRWMNLTRDLKDPPNKHSRQIVFDGEPLTMQAVWRLRDSFFPPAPWDRVDGRHRFDGASPRGWFANWRHLT